VSGAELPWTSSSSSAQGVDRETLVTTEMVKSVAHESGVEESSLSRPFKVLFPTTNHLPYVGGAEFGTHHLATSLTERGHEVVVLTGLARRTLRGLIELGTAAAKMAPAGHADTRLGFQTVRSRPLDVLKSHVSDFRPTSSS
jgi:hypothetical protein